ncbi:GNAT family N-acetyltransferase [Nesterenkonia haasae]|uniref:GNAT family N-acetyltransferase n=1 Tax=Nesterenkonia haasae TaxID=2587813 RepID=UPI00129201FD|nr:GNAT family N-acetyltransferase [Nesterenkonia haasae]NDK32905.1 N-acetyltransferase [Nesterenkonia haasae]
MGRHRRSEQKNIHPTAELVVDHDRCRAELWDTVHGKRTFIGFVGYAEETIGGQPVWLLMHTIVNDRFGRQGYARALVTLLLDRLAEEGKRFTSECTYIDQYLSRYPEYRRHQALLA